MTHPATHPTAHPLALAIYLVGVKRIARELGITAQAMYRWRCNGRMPRTEWTGETAYSKRIQQLTENRVTRKQLLAAWPPWPTGPTAELDAA